MSDVFINICQARAHRVNSAVRKVCICIVSNSVCCIYCNIKSFNGCKSFLQLLVTQKSSAINLSISSSRNVAHSVNKIQPTLLYWDVNCGIGHSQYQDTD